MYISNVTIENFRCFGSGEKRLTLPLETGLTALVGENDSGKTAVIDALRFVFGTRDQEYFRIQESDFHWSQQNGKRQTEIKISCLLMGLTAREKGSFAEYLTYLEDGDTHDAVLYVNWTARHIAGARSARRFVSVEVRSGANGDGPTLDPEARNLLRATYLRPLRDAERAMSAGRGSRLSQILQHTKEIRELGQDFDPNANPQLDVDELSVLGVGDYASALLRSREGIKEARKRLNEDYLDRLSFSGDRLFAEIEVSSAVDKEARLRHLLEKLELELHDPTSPGVAPNRGLGSNNILFMACELLLLGAEEEGFPLLLIEEPEAHLHPQRQLRLMHFLQEQTKWRRVDDQAIQIIVTTHSPNLASVIKLNNLVLLNNGKAFPLLSGETQLEPSDYRFLERFLDVTKANLFFARGVMIVEGDGENILVPTLARLIGCDFTEYGVSIINVGGIGLRRFARILQRNDPRRDGTVCVPVACIADLDVMPDCAPKIIGLTRADEDLPDLAGRRWRVKSDFTPDEYVAYGNAVRTRADGQNVKTFVSDEWTLEYDLARAGLAKDVWVAAYLAKADAQISNRRKNIADVVTEAEDDFSALDDELSEEELASNVYALFVSGARASKAIAAQYFAERLQGRVDREELTREELEQTMPPYLVDAIKYVTTKLRPDVWPIEQGRIQNGP